MIFGQASYPNIHELDCSIDRLQAVLQITISGDVRECQGRGEDQGQPDIVVCGYAVVAATLQIE